MTAVILSSVEVAIVIIANSVGLRKTTTCGYVQYGPKVLQFTNWGFCNKHATM